MGAALCLVLADRAPDRVRSLTLVGPAGTGQKINAEFIRGYIGARSRDELAAAAAAALRGSAPSSRTDSVAAGRRVQAARGRRRGADEDRLDPLWRHPVGAVVARGRGLRADARDLGPRRRDHSRRRRRANSGATASKCTSCPAAGTWCRRRRADEVNRADRRLPASLSAAPSDRPRAIQGRLRPSRSWLVTQSPASTALPSDTSPASTTAATISASRSALPIP